VRNSNCHLRFTSLRSSASGSFRWNCWCPFFIHLHLKIILFYLRKKYKSIKKYKYIVVQTFFISIPIFQFQIFGTKSKYGDMESAYKVKPDMYYQFDKFAFLWNKENLYYVFLRTSIFFVIISKIKNSF